MPKILGIDWGRARIGVAISDPIGVIARPLTVLNARNSDPIQKIKEIIAREGAEMVVVGYPLRWDDRESKRCKEVRDFIEKLRDALEVPVLAVDEWGTSQGLVSDAVSAARILQYYLDTGDRLEV
ncbi:MAG: Holliday junction resolvase RuvX [candidate division WOR-3 bacterium]